MTRTLGRAVLQTKKNSPHIFFAAGVVGVAGSAVLACRATLKLEKELDHIKSEVDFVKAAPGISDQERQRLLAVKYGRGAGRLIRLYGPSLALGAAGVAALAGSHVQLVRRNSAISGALALVSQAYDDYRGRVRDEVGEEKELDIFRSITTQEVIEDGKKHKIKSVGGGRSPYARIFDESSPYWQNDPELNLMFLRCIQQYWNDRLHAYGHVFLNEVYEALGFEHTSPGAVVGWIRNETHDPAKGAGFIDFGIYDLTNGRFVNGMEKSVLLDFNVDNGTIWEKI